MKLDEEVDKVLSSLVHKRVMSYSAISNARATIESFTKHVLDKEKIDNSKDHKKLLKEVLVNYIDDKNTQDMIQNLDNVIKNISNLRNEKGDDHGQTPNHVSAEEHEARLAVGAVILIMDFITMAKNSKVANLNKK